LDTIYKLEPQVHCISIDILGATGEVSCHGSAATYLYDSAL